MNKLELIRLSDNGKQTEGILYLYKNNKIIYSCKTLELPWRNNQRQLSCIPTGTYKAIKHNSPKFGNTLWLQDVPNRYEILIHYGNYYFNSTGCILVGNEFRDINKDGLEDALNSIRTLRELLKLTPNKIEIEIKYRE